MNSQFPDEIEVIECAGIRVPFVPSIITPRIERPMRKGRYEAGEIAAVRDLIGPGDRVLDLGAGVGLVSCAAAKIVGGANVTAIEANPNLLPMIHDVYQRNGVSGVDLRLGIVGPTGGKSAKLYLRNDFWASSIEPDSRPYIGAVDVPVIGLADLIADVRPTVLVCDIEGAERGLFQPDTLKGIRVVIVELHPKVYGEDGRQEVLASLRRAGFSLDPRNAHSTVRILTRDKDVRSVTSDSPRILVSTCMKDEGPYILEWLAWHKAIGVTDFVVFTNDCSDGTTEILDHLTEHGEVLHLPNPAVAVERSDLQPVALRYVQQMREFRQADYFISMDVDEFINVRVGQGHIKDLLGVLPSFDVLSISEILHGSNGRVEFEDGLVTEQFPRHQTELPGWQKRHCGVKSLVRLSDRIARIRNHRPDIKAGVSDPVWLDGSARPTEHFLDRKDANGHNVRETYELVSLDHFPLKSVHTYLAKVFKGDVVVPDKTITPRYWRRRNMNGSRTSTFDRQQPAFRSELARLMNDGTVAALHHAACAAHQSKIALLLEQREFQDRKRQILDQMEEVRGEMEGKEAF